MNETQALHGQAKLGIAVITYRRRASFELLIGKLEQHTRAEHELVVADDGSEDGIVDWCRERSIAIVTGENRGVAWNKNRAIFALELLGCDPILILEDDVYPDVDGWEQEWIAATEAWHHVAYEHPRVAQERLSGSGTAEDPFLNVKATAALLSISRRALAIVGYYDSRFIGYGFAHGEWTTRIKRAGYGYRKVTLPDGSANEALFHMIGGIVDNEGERWIDREQMQINRALQTQTQREPIFRCPWRTPAERATFLREQLQAGIDGGPLAAMLDRRRSAQLLAPSEVLSAEKSDVEELRARLAELESQQALALVEWQALATDIERACASRSWRVGHGLTSAAHWLLRRPSNGTSALANAHERVMRVLRELA